METLFEGDEDEDNEAGEDSIPTPMERGNGSDEPPPHPLQLGLDEDRGDPDEVDAMFDGPAIPTLQQLLNTSHMPYLVYDADQPANGTLLLTSEEYRTYSVTVAFIQVMTALVRCWNVKGYDQRAVLSAMVMVRSQDSHLPLRGGGAVKRRGQCSHELASLCAQHTRERNAFIICLAMAEEPAVIHTWCNPEKAPFHWLFLDSLCRSIQGVLPGPHLLDKEKILVQFASKGQRTQENESNVMSIFNELDIL